MADYVTHMLAARECLKSMKKRGDSGIARLFCLGAQGPDLLFYLGYTGLRGGLEWGRALHRLQPEAVLDLSHDAARAGNMECAAYLAGFALHLWVDNAVHPTIDACAERYAAKTGMSMDAAHVCIESGYESRELLEKQGVSIRRYRWQDDLVWESKTYSALLDGMQEVFRCADEEMPPRRTIRRALRRLPLLFSLLFDRTGVVLLLVRVVGLFQRPLSAALWHVKRPVGQYPADALSAENVSAIRQLIEEGKGRFLQAACSQNRIN